MCTLLLNLSLATHEVTKNIPCRNIPYKRLQLDDFRLLSPSAEFIRYAQTMVDNYTGLLLAFHSRRAMAESTITGHAKTILVPFGILTLLIQIRVLIL